MVRTLAARQVRDNAQNIAICSQVLQGWTLARRWWKRGRVADGGLPACAAERGNVNAVPQARMDVSAEPVAAVRDQRGSVRGVKIVYGSSDPCFFEGPVRAGRVTRARIERPNYDFCAREGLFAPPRSGRPRY